jgi:outer membrane protein OmpA-like peptidoglycan-associated protein
VRRVPFRPLAALALLAAVAAAPPPLPAAASPAQEGGDDRTGEPRVVDLAYRVAAVDGSQLSVETPDRRTVTLTADMMFDGDRSDPNADGRDLLDALAEDLSGPNGRVVTIEVHTDGEGDPEANQGLSERRAVAVRSRLSVQLDESTTLEATGYGGTRPGEPAARVVVSYPLD